MSNSRLSISRTRGSVALCTAAGTYVSIRQRMWTPTSAYVSVRQRAPTSAYVSICACQHASACVSIRTHAEVSHCARQRRHLKLAFEVPAVPLCKVHPRHSACLVGCYCGLQRLGAQFACFTDTKVPCVTRTKAAAAPAPAAHPLSQRWCW